MRVAAAAAEEDVGGSLVLAFRGGAVSSIISAAMCILGVSMLYITAYVAFCAFGDESPHKIPFKLAGYGFGASMVALFMQVVHRALNNSF